MFYNVCIHLLLFSDFFVFRKMSEESSELSSDTSFSSSTNSSPIVEEKELTRKEKFLPTKDEYYLLLREYETFRRLNFPISEVKPVLELDETTALIKYSPLYMLKSSKGSSLHVVESNDKQKKYILNLMFNLIN